MKLPYPRLGLLGTGSGKLALARIIREARCEGGKSAAVPGPSERSRPRISFAGQAQAYFQYVEDRRSEKVPEMQCYCSPQQSAHE
jgi:hypothetical protein